MVRSRPIVQDLLADLPTDAEAAPVQSMLPPKPKKVKKAQPKAKATDAEAEDALPISKLAESKRSTPRDEDVHLYPLPRTIKEGKRTDLKKLLGLPILKRKAPLLLNFIPTYKSTLPDVPRKRKKSLSPPTATTLTASTSRTDQESTSDPADLPSTSAPYLIPIPEHKRRRRLVKTAEMVRSRPIVQDLLADLPTDAEAAPVQSMLPPKPKKVKKAQPKAKATDAEAEDALPISKLAETLLLPNDLERNAKFSEYENYALMLQHSAQAIQHAHSFSMQSFENRQRLVDMKREASSMKREIKSLEAKMKKLEDQAEAATKAQTLALEKAEAAEAVRKVAEAEKREAEAGKAQAEKELQQALATKEAEVKEADEKAYAQERSVESTIAEIDAEIEAEKVAEEIPPESFEVPVPAVADAQES
ncbi:uncharacterized abhydrolase domain-containing protein DDB_G0269086-like [Camellia sinensis]|uniref:uncharacterized abhydrolase domain-containing protein DDB_G0269086-like n=1 Tax=Camellia sinensis TaxID=4442 RepID=UPI00103576EC|nr:uncharacterized abhydrolase domain-containing protein DDB_G0269086-like [Camellia sinensis]